MKSRPLSKPAATAWAGGYAAAAVALVAGAVGSIFWPAAEQLALLPKILFPMATFLTVAAVAAFMRRDPNAPTKWKDLARPFFAAVSVLSSMLAALHPLWALGGVIGVGAATWAGLSNGWMDRALVPKEGRGESQNVEPTRELDPIEADAPLQEMETDGRDNIR